MDQPDGHIHVKNECAFTVFISASTTDEGHIIFLVRAEPHEDALEVPPEQMFTLTVDDDLRECRAKRGSWDLRVTTVLPIRADNVRRTAFHDGPIVCLEPNISSVLS